MFSEISVCALGLEILYLSNHSCWQSTFAKALEEHLPNRFRRCNQDDLGDRRKVETLARATLREGMSPCVDRVNFDPS